QRQAGGRLEPPHQLVEGGAALRRARALAALEPILLAAVEQRADLLIDARPEPLLDRDRDERRRPRDHGGDAEQRPPPRPAPPPRPGLPAQGPQRPCVARGRGSTARTRLGGPPRAARGAAGSRSGISGRAGSAPLARPSRSTPSGAA